jgi:CDP-glucose 4,6-dehydratase
VEFRAGAVEDLGMNRSFWEGKKVFMTGNTGFKGSWLSLWLLSMGAQVSGYALEPYGEHYLFNLCSLKPMMPTCFNDIADLGLLQQTLWMAEPEIVFHLAAQPLVRASYQEPVLTYQTNVLGTVHLLEAVRNCSSVKAVVIVTTDKCYDNREWFWGYRENEPLGGYDPYSSSKVCAELATAAYRSSFFPPDDYPEHGVAIATARAGNVIGGGDWAKERLLPDMMRALLAARPIVIRNPKSIRPWQHVLEPLAGYLTLAEKLYQDGPAYGEAWNFGPADQDNRTVEWIVNYFCLLWGKGATYMVDTQKQPHEAQFLKLDCSKAQIRLEWRPHWSLKKTLDKTVEWLQEYQNKGDIKEVCLQQIGEYEKSLNK